MKLKPEAFLIHGRSLIFVPDRVFTIDGILRTCSRKSLSAFVINLTWPSIFRRSTLVVSARRSCLGSEVAPDFETVWRLGQDGFRVSFCASSCKNYGANASFEMKSPVLPGKIYRRRCAGSLKLAKFLTLIDETLEGIAVESCGSLPQCIIPGWKLAGSGKRLRDRHPAGEAEPNRTEGRSISPRRREIRCPE
jgi:hypothetical protein